APPATTRTNPLSGLILLGAANCLACARARRQRPALLIEQEAGKNRALVLVSGSQGWLPCQRDGVRGGEARAKTGRTTGAGTRQSHGYRDNRVADEDPPVPVVSLPRRGWAQQFRAWNTGPKVHIYRRFSTSAQGAAALQARGSAERLWEDAAAAPESALTMTRTGMSVPPAGSEPHPCRWHSAGVSLGMTGSLRVAEPLREQDAERAEATRPARPGQILIRGAC
ncbi:hypothetical protein LY78DRAFT_732038, partial [Colletotrichum sublineola]